MSTESKGGEGRPWRLGERVRIGGFLIRQGDFAKYPSVQRYWIRVAFKQPLKGVLVGLRTLSNGVALHMGEDGVDYKAKEYFQAALVATDLRKRSYLVLLSSLERGGRG